MQMHGAHTELQIGRCERMDVARRQLPTVRLRRLATRLATLRSEAGLSREQVEEQTGINSTTLYRIETARTKPQRRTLLTLLDLYGVSDKADRDDLVALSKHSSELGWLRQYESDLREPYSNFISFESEARSVRNYESLFVPGLLQTEDYARAVIRGVLPHATNDEVEKRVEVRVQRKTVLTKDDPLSLWCVIDEAAVRRKVGGDKIMQGQLVHLIEATAAPTTVLQIIPFAAGAHPGMPGSFVVMSFPEPTDPDIIYLDSMGGDLFLERSEDVERFTTVFEHLRATALSPADTVRMLEEIR